MNKIGTLQAARVAIRAWRGVLLSGVMRKDRVVLVGFTTRIKRDKSARLHRVYGKQSNRACADGTRRRDLRSSAQHAQ